MPLASRINNAANAEPKTKRAKTAKKSTRVSSRQSAAAAAKADAAAAAAAINNTTTSSTENEDINAATDKIPAIRDEPQAAPLRSSTNKMRTKSSSTVVDKPMEDLNTTDKDLAEDTIMTDVNETSTHEEVTPVTPAAVAATPAAGPIIVNTRTRTKPGFVLSVGENLSNQLGLTLDVDSRKKPQLIKMMPNNGTVVQAAAGGMHSACLTDDGTVYTFGCNDEFALGRANDDDIERVELPEKIIEITAGDSHTAALSETGIVYAWGTFRDGNGVLGLEQKKIAKTPMRFKLKEKIAKISSGADHLVFLTTTGEVYTAGNSEHGQLGRISKYNSCRGGRRGCDMILEPGLVRIGKRKELHGSKLVEDVWTSAYCTFLKVKDSDSVIAFGLNNSYQLGAIDMENRYQPDLIQSLKFEGKLTKVVGGMHHTLFLDSNGFVYAMGSHRYGCLGLGKVDSDLCMPERIPNLVDVIDIAANTNTSYAIDKHGKAFSWGTNYSSQLAQDDEEDYFVPTQVQSRHLDARDTYTVSIGGQHALFILGPDKETAESK